MTATLARRVRAVLIGVLTILALTGPGARVVRLVVHHQTLRRQGLAARRVLPQPVEGMVAVGDSITKGDWDVYAVLSGVVTSHGRMASRLNARRWRTRTLLGVRPGVRPVSRAL